MTIIEQKYMELVPLYLKQIALNLKHLCDLLSEHKDEILVGEETEN